MRFGCFMLIFVEMFRQFGINAQSAAELFWNCASRYRKSHALLIIYHPWPHIGVGHNDSITLNMVYPYTIGSFAWTFLKGTESHERSTNIARILKNARLLMLFHLDFLKFGFFGSDADLVRNVCDLKAMLPWTTVGVFGATLALLSKWLENETKLQVSRMMVAESNGPSCVPWPNISASISAVGWNGSFENSFCRRYAAPSGNRKIFSSFSSRRIRTALSLAIKYVKCIPQ